MEIKSIEVGVTSKIFLFRGHKVMLDKDLAELYGVETRRLNEQVKRNINRFPEDFMFQLSNEEMEIWMSQIGVALINSVDNVCRYRLAPFVNG